MSVAAFLILRNGRNHTSGVPKIGESATPRVTLLRISHNLCVVTRGGNSRLCFTWSEGTYKCSGWILANCLWGIAFTVVLNSNLRVFSANRIGSYLVDPASSHMLVSKIKPCMSKYKRLYCETANGSLNQLWFIWWYLTTWITVVILELIHAGIPDFGRDVFIR